MSEARRKRFVPLAPLLVGVLVLGLAGCLDADAPSSEGESNPVGTEGRRLVVIAPAAAEMLDRLGLADRIVAVGEFGPWPSSLAGLPVAGGYASPNVEQILDLRADTLISAASKAAVAAHRRLESLGVRVLALDTSTHEGVFEALKQLGLAFDRVRQANEIADGLRSELRQIETEAEGVPSRTVLFVVGRDPLYVAGPGSHIDRMITSVGGINVAAGLLSSYAQLSMEAVLEALPDVIIDSSDNRPGAPFGPTAGSWDQFEFLPAVKNRQVHRIHPSRLVIPGLRLPEMTRLMGRLIQPERFGEPTNEDYQAPEANEAPSPSAKPTR